MLPIGDENPHPPGFKPKLTYALIAINVIIFFFEVAVTGQFFEFSNHQAMNLFLNWGGTMQWRNFAAITDLSSNAK